MSGLFLNDQYTKKNIKKNKTNSTDKKENMWHPSFFGKIGRYL